MPCNNYEASDLRIDRINELEKQLSEREAMLCAVLEGINSYAKSWHEDKDHTEIFQYINEKEAGVTKKQIIKWYTNHKKNDEKRKLIEEEKERMKNIKEEADKKADEARKKVYEKYGVK